MIVTGFSVEGYRVYGERLIKTLKLFAPEEKLLVYPTGYEENYKLYKSLRADNIIIRDQNTIPRIQAFVNFHKCDPIYNGRLAFEKWTDRERRADYSFRFDAVKFCRMVFIMHDAANYLQNGNMVWLDGDNVVRKQLPSSWKEKSLQGKSFAYLGREPKHSETGYLVFRLPDCLPIVNDWADFYTKRTFIDQKEWHSAFLFDRAREKHPEIPGHNLTPGGSGHVIHKCWVGEYFDHCKGNRKFKGRSPEAR